MKYLNDYNSLKKQYTYKKDKIVLDKSDICIYNFPFTSEPNGNFPDSQEIKDTTESGKKIISKIAEKSKTGCPESLKILDCIDSDISQNNNFIYPVYAKDSNIKSDSVIILLHGLNEKTWDKYHTWAKALLELTRKPVLMFPISFHINRVPPSWTHPRIMDNLSKERKSMYQDITETSFVNAAISTRLQYKPETFFRSGLRTFLDLKKLLSQIKNNEHPLISKDATVDFFSYSIGAFLTEIMLMENYNGWFTDSKAFLFCGGPTMSGMYATSKYIYDSETYKSMTNFYVKNFETEIQKIESMRNYFDNREDAADDFKSMLNIDLLRTHRENKLNGLSEKIKAVALAKDEVIPPKSVLETLNGGNINIPVEVLDFPFEYDHISPFSLDEKIQDVVDKSFNEVFNIAGDFLK